MWEALRPEPHRGDTVAAGVVTLTVALVLVQMRFGSEWGPGAHLVYLLPAAGAVFAMGALSAVEDAKPRPYQSGLYVCSFVLALFALGRTADVLGADGLFSAAGTVYWVGVALTALAAWFAVARGSAVMTLVALVTGGIAVVAFVEWVGDPGLRTVRWILLLLAIGYLLGAVGQRDRRPEHGVGFADAAGLAVLAIGVTFLITTLLGTLFDFFAEGFFEVEGDEIGAGWELVLVTAGFGLCAYGAVDRWRGPVYLGIANLAVFILIASVGQVSLLWWPLLLLAGAGSLLVAGLRPSIPAPPPPDEHVPPAPTQPLPPQPPPPDDAPTTRLWGA